MTLLTLVPPVAARRRATPAEEAAASLEARTMILEAIDKAIQVANLHPNERARLVRCHAAAQRAVNVARVEHLRGDLDGS